MAYTGTSIVDYLKSVGTDSSYTARAKRAEQLGITGYQGTAAQNTQMLNLLRNGQKPSVDVTPIQDDPIQQSPVLTGTTQQKPAAVQNNTPKTQDAAITALDNISPERQKTNELTESLLSSFNTPYNPSTDTSFQAAKGELQSSADRVHKNTMAGYLGNQSGNFNSAALQIAAGAQNDILGQIPLLQGEYEDRFNANRSKNLSDTSNMVNMLLGLEDRDISAKDKAFQKQIDTIGQYYKDFQAEIDRRKEIDPSDPLIPYLKVARQEKIASQEAAEAKAAEARTEADQAAYKNALNLWEQYGTVPNQQIADILGVPVGAKTADYDIKRIQANTASYNATTSRMNAETSKMNAETSKTKAEKDEGKPLFSGKDYYEDALAMKNEMVETEPGGSFENGFQNTKTPKYTANDVISAVFGYGLDDDTTAEILTRLKYTDTDIEKYLKYIEPAYFGNFRSSGN